MESKVCKKCGINKELSEYHKNYKAKDGKQGSCKKCGIASAMQSAKQNKDKINTRRRVRRATDPEYRKNISLLKKKSYWLNKESVLLSNAKRSFKQRGITCELVKGDIIIPDICPVFKIPFDKDRYSASLDRIDNTKGYIKGNVWVISRLANTMKNDGTLDEILIFCENLPKLIKEKINYPE